jgi:eukaryotic-like serine/threonine-protein kinase
MNPYNDQPSLPPGLAGRLNSACDSFEEQWLAGAEPRLEEFLPLVDETDRRALLRELLALELEYRDRLGQQPRREQYEQRLPDYADVIAAAFAAPQQQIPTPVNPDDGQTEPQMTREKSMCPDLSETSSPSETIAQDLPKRVGRYHVEHEIARGGMGQVMRVTDDVFQRPLAMKIALGGLSDDAYERFVREALLTGQLQHPGIPPVQEMGQLEDGRPYFIMKLIKGSDLGLLLRKRASPAEALPQFVAIFEQICQTLGYAHSHGIIHRDLKPGNIMVGAFGEVQVMDWGLAKLLTDAPAELRDHPSGKRQLSTVFAIVTPHTLPKETEPGTVMGTSAYMPPEQARGEADTLDSRSDVFGLGGILCEMLTGRPPFAEKTSLENQRLSMKGDLSAAVVRLDACGADTELINLTKLCLAPHREDRPAHAGVIAESIAWYQAALQERMQQAEIDKASALVKVREERKRRRVSLALAGAVLLLFVGGSAGAFWYQAEMAGQDADKIRRDSELALRREYSDEKVSADVALAEQRLQDLLGQLADQNKLNELLSDIDQWQIALKEAQAPWLRAQVVADGSKELVDEALGERLRRLKDNLEAAEKDFRFGKACDDARLAAATSVEGTWNPGLAAEKYPAIFAEARLDVMQDNSDSITAYIKESPIRLVYLAALDDWADALDDRTLLTGATNPKLHSRLVAIANELDNDLWRKEFRHVRASKDKAKLRALAGKVELRAHSPQILVALARRLPKKAEGAMLLRTALADHPRDFWIIFYLGDLLTDPAEREGCYRVALAIRPLSSPAHNNLGNALLDKKDVEGAIKHYRKALDINPRLAQAYCNLGIACRDKKDLEMAIKHYGKALNISPNDAKTFHNLGIAIAESDLDQAIKHFYKAIDLIPNYAKAHDNLGNSLRLKNDPDGAIKHYLKAIEIDANFAEPHYDLGIVLIEKNDVKGAIGHYRRALQIDPNHAKAHNNLGKALQGKKEMDEALEHYRKALEIDPNLVQPHYNLGNIQLYKKNWDGAIKHFLKALKVDPKYAEAHVNLGIALKAKKNLTGAATQFLKALEINPELAEAHVNLGRIHFEKREMDDAIKHHLKALSINPDYALGHFCLGLALLDKNDVDEAIKHFRKALDLNPNDADAHVNLGIALVEKNDVDRAIKHYQKALDINANLLQAHHNLGNALLRKKKLEAAIFHYRKALDVDPGDHLSHYGLGNALREKKDVAGAIKHFRNALAINPYLAEAHVNLGNLLRGNQDVEGAINHYRKALDINPRLLQAHYNLALGLLAMEKFGAARAAVQECVKLLPPGHPQQKLIQQQLERCDRLLALDKQLSGIFQGQAQPDNAAGLLALTDLCQRYKQYNGSATRFYAAAFEKNPALADDLQKNLRYDAACVAVLAAAGKGKDADRFKDPDRTRFRQLAFDWLRADLALWRKQLKTGNVAEVLLLQQKLAQWRRDPNLAGVHDADELSGLSREEREPWQEFWADVAQLLKEADVCLIKKSAQSNWEAIRTGKAQPENAAEAIDFAKQSIKKRHYALATRMYREAFRTEPALAEKLDLGHRYNAACYAVLAAAGKGDDAAELKPEQAAQLRQEALAWLKADLTSWTKRVPDGADADRKAAAKKLGRWQRDTDLTWVRDGDLADLPADERLAWQQFWVDLAALLKKVESQPR